MRGRSRGSGARRRGGLDGGGGRGLIGWEAVVAAAASYDGGGGPPGSKAGSVCLASSMFKSCCWIFREILAVMTQLVPRYLVLLSTLSRAYR